MGATKQPDKGEKMKVRNLSDYQQQLLLRLKELETSISNIKNKMIEIAEAQTNLLQDNLDHAMEQLDLSNCFKIIHMHSIEKNKILDALNRIEKGTFGECIDCGDVIGGKRLSVQPSASLCVECQNLKEDCIGLGVGIAKKINIGNVLPFLNFGVEVA